MEHPEPAVSGLIANTEPPAGGLVVSSRYPQVRRGFPGGDRKEKRTWPSVCCSASVGTAINEVVDNGPTPPVVVDADGQLEAEYGVITHAGEDPDGELWRWLS